MPVDSNVQILDEELTTNINYLQPTGFRVVIDRARYPNLEFFVQSVSHPNADVNPVEVGYSRINTISVPGDKIQFGDLSLTIILDEDMSSYQELYSWLERLIETEQTSASERFTKIPTYADMTLHILSSHNNTTKKIRYKDCVPTGLGQIEFQSTTGDLQFVTFTATFRFTEFELV